LVPPASEHGSHADENAAARTEAYFSDVELTGIGEVKRCKLLILGNGDAGKTCLSLALTGGDPRQASRLGSTHGIQFMDWDFRANVDGLVEPVHLHLWDFGGQEIYHNTHRLFMGKGTVFVVVWKPQQDGRNAPRADGGYQDEWRPLQYWLDFIHLACPHKPRIAIVCSHHSDRSKELEDQWQSQVRPEFREECECFFIDSLARRGQLSELQKWLQDEVGSAIATQGTSVPSYGQITQDMTENWGQRLVQDPTSRPATTSSLKTSSGRDSGTKSKQRSNRIEAGSTASWRTRPGAENSS
jgi:GTPase SAR1 family protein